MTTYDIDPHALVPHAKLMQILNEPSIYLILARWKGNVAMGRNAITITYQLKRIRIAYLDMGAMDPLRPVISLASLVGMIAINNELHKPVLTTFAFRASQS